MSPLGPDLWINKAGGFELRITSVQGSGVPPSRRLFARHDVKWITPMDWSPDGKAIAVGLLRGDQTAQIGLVAVPDGSLRVLKSVDWRGPTRIFFSPNGRDLGFDLPVSDTSDQRDVFVLAVDGSRQVPALRAAQGERFVNFQGMPWTSDSRGFLVRKRLPRTSELWFVPATGEPPRKLDVDASQ